MNRSITTYVHELVRPHLQPGDTALDATAGNGHDTLFLAQCVGPAGRVFAWDRQPVALVRTGALLKQHGVDWVELILGDHAELEIVPEPRFTAAIFNLGYLPGGDKTIRTAAESSIRAVRAAAKRLAPGGILTVAAYTGHTGGAEEAEAVHDALRQLESAELGFHEVVFPAGRTAPPQLFVVDANPKSLRHHPA